MQLKISLGNTTNQQISSPLRIKGLRHVKLGDGYMRSEPLTTLYRVQHWSQVSDCQIEKQSFQCTNLRVSNRETPEFSMHRATAVSRSAVSSAMARAISQPEGHFLFGSDSRFL
ncbi:hypothetical protein RRG08_032169 [Elysia crispata]|uniref:Uncharacterized protein n=1 Tax=Elysia crispata TaxID=231223 RepID=A0AAE1ACF7_9GAST|nr:hypothetical protein RRG08_032169 [Elysia crispata]